MFYLFIFFSLHGPKVYPKNAKKWTKVDTVMSSICVKSMKKFPFLLVFSHMACSPLPQSLHTCSKNDQKTYPLPKRNSLLHKNTSTTKYNHCMLQQKKWMLSDIFYGVINTCTVTNDLLQLVIKQKSSVLFGHELCFSAETNVRLVKHESVKTD